MVDALDARRAVPITVVALDGLPLRNTVTGVLVTEHDGTLTLARTDGVIRQSQQGWRLGLLLPNAGALDVVVHERREGILGGVRVEIRDHDAGRPHRDNVRTPFPAVPVDVMIAGVSVAAALMNLSIVGAGLDTHGELPIGGEVEIRSGDGSDATTVTGIVVRSSAVGDADVRRVGIRFDLQTRARAARFAVWARGAARELDPDREHTGPVARLSA